MDVRKTNGSVEEFDKAKLARGIHQAYKTAKEYCDDAIVVSIINNLYIYEGITSAEIRRQVEESLMSINKKVALAYIEKFDADLDLRKKRDFIKDYIAASNAATGSKFDSNANVTRKTEQKHFKLIKNAHVIAPEDLGVKDVLVAGNYVFKSANPLEAIATLNRL